MGYGICDEQGLMTGSISLDTLAIYNVSILQHKLNQPNAIGLK